MNKIDIILRYLDELFPNPQSELIYNHDYELLISVVLSAQTTDKKVNKVTNVLFNRYSSLEALKEASLKDISDILRPLGMYNKKALYVKEIASILHDKYNDRIINDRNILQELSGVGRKTANLVLAILYNEPYLAVDTHITRVSRRLGLVRPKGNVLVIEKKLTKIINKDYLVRAHYQLVLFGRYYCTAVKPKCNNCKLKEICRYKKKQS